MKYDYDSGFRAIKHQIYPSMIALGTDPDELEKYTFSLLNRTCPGWIKS